MEKILNMKYEDDFLKLIKTPLDNSQYAALSTPGNTVIAAGAGSGKTQVLATRFAWLVLTGQADAPQILTLTFTNKAAAEMYQRIYKTLRFFAEHEECTELNKTQIGRAKAALEAFSDVHIQTLDSYCASILRTCANRYGIKPDFVTGTGDGTRQVKDSAFKFVLQHKDSSGIQTFADPGKLQDFAENIVAKIILDHTSLATESGWFTQKFAIQLQKICTAWNQLIIGNGEGSIYKYVEIIDNNLKTSPKKNDKDKLPYVKQIEKLVNKGYELNNLQKLTSEDIKTQNDNIQNSLTALEDFFAEVYTAQGMKGKISTVSTENTKLRDKIQDFNSIAVFIKQYDALLNFNQLLDEFLESVNLSKRISGNLSFYDVTELALKILIENEDILEQEKNAYKKIMIDEFQDNNGKNRDLLYLIAPKDEGKLFFVGDEKQSIYKFRGADVTVFNELSSAEENTLVYMTYNYRSEANLVKAFNILFKNGNGIFESYSDSSNKNKFEAYYDKDAAKRASDGQDMVLPELTKENVPIHFCMLDKNLITENDKELPEKRKNLIPEKEQVAYFIAKKIRELHDKGESWNSFTILDRSRTNRDILTKYLSLFNIPYSVDVFKNIFQDGIINDFYNFLRLCVYPSDVNAFAAWLCSPLAGLRENSLEIILSHLSVEKPSEENGIKKYVFDINTNKDNEIKTDLETEEFEKYKTAMEKFFELRPLVLKQRLTTTLSYLWNDLGYKYETMMSENLLLNSEHFDMLYELARQSEEDGKTVAWFIDQLEILKKNEKNANGNDSDIDAGDISYPLERNEAVQIMTIHKSKGLQFEHVFIYGCTDMRSKVSSSNFFFEEESGVSIKSENGSANFFFIQCKDIEKQKELAEIRRVIYVAVTRAIKDVYLVGTLNYKGSTGEIRLIEDTVINFYKNLRLQDSTQTNETSKIIYNPEAAFDLEDIPVVEYSELPQKKSDSPDELRKEIEERSQQLYKKATTIEYESHAISRKTPSSLEPEFTPPADSDSGEKYETSEDTLRNADFTAADFGTLVHAYLEMQAKGIKPDEFEPEPKYFKNLKEPQIAETKETCKRMCMEFAESEPGKQLVDAQTASRFWRAEWGFRMFWKCDAAPEGAIFTGSIDLIYENADGTYTICDYKSDTEIDSEKYRAQQECYRAAASKMLKISEEKISLILYYLRHKECVNIST